MKENRDGGAKQASEELKKYEKWNGMEECKE
jgi:hypothetical protein